MTHYNGSVVRMSYDSLNRVARTIQTLPNGFSATNGYSYDADGNKTQMTTPWGNFIYTYDALNRLTSITTPQGRVFSFAYDALGRRTSLTYPNGITTSYVYNAAGQLLTIVHLRTADGVAIASAAYAYDAAGNRTNMTDADGTHAYGYDALNRLLSAVHPSASLVATKNEAFSYDAVGNRLSDANLAGYTYDAANRLLSNNGFTYTYDANGNQTGKFDRTTFQQTAYSYDSQNELIGASLPDGTAAAYKYDALGRRIEKSTGALAGQIIRYIYDGQDILAMLDGGNNLLAVFTHGPGIDEPLELRKADGTEFYLHADGLGSIAGHTDALGRLVERIEYQAYGTPAFVDLRSGAPLVAGRSFTSNPFAFTSKEFDPETGLFYYRARCYDPNIGRFIQEEFTGDDGPNLYWYTYDNPVRNMDAYGLAAEGAVVGGAVGGTIGSFLGAAIESIGGAFAGTFALPGGGTLVGGAIGFDLGAIQGGVLGTAAGAAVGSAVQDFISLAKGGKQRIRDSTLEGIPSEEIDRRAQDRSLSPKERRKYQREQKARAKRNKRKRNKCPQDL